jgi:hypothetical protein
MITSDELAAIGKAVRHYQPQLVASLVAEGYKPEDRQLAIYVLRSLGDWEAAYAARRGRELRHDHYVGGQS